MFKKIIIIMCMALSLIGCDWFSETVNNVNAETYAKYAGKAVAVTITGYDSFVKDSNLKTVVMATLDTIIAKMPTDITPSNVTVHINNAIDSKIAETAIDDSQKEFYKTSLKFAFQSINQILEMIIAKYPDDFKNADKTYSLVVTFLSSAKSVFGNGLFAAEPANDEYIKVLNEVNACLKAKSTNANN